MPSQKRLQPSLLTCSVCVYEGKSIPHVTKTVFHTQILSGKFKCQTWFKKDTKLILHHQKHLKTKWKKEKKEKGWLLIKTDKSANLTFLLYTSLVVRWCFLLLWGVFSYFITMIKPHKLLYSYKDRKWEFPFPQESAKLRLNRTSQGTSVSVWWWQLLGKNEYCPVIFSAFLYFQTVKILYFCCPKSKKTLGQQVASNL